MSDKVSITVIPDGPLKVSGATSATYCGEALEVDGDFWLCRCGESANAPFCDGSHSKVGFVGTSKPREDRVKVWEGKTLRTYFNAKTCMHVFSCKPLKELRQRELEGDAEAAAEIMRVVGTCPSGALSYELKSDIPEPAPAEAAAPIEIMEGGEIRVQAEFEINAPLQERQASNKATLCRCGQSLNKPWCDGRHSKKENFR